MYLEAINYYCIKFPEVKNIKQRFDRLNISEKEKFERFFIYTYWYFDEYYAQSLHNFGYRYKETTEHSDENEVFLTHLWKKTIEHIDFYYEYRKYSSLFKEMSYEEFGDYASENSFKLYWLTED
ncbi:MULTISPECIES: hypothetical protein [Enterococcus]|uniref:Uncharacterized protein n=1 Tax=Enterococcus faecium TaxID=1352 RepID=A0AB73Q347_ENTFC|nr:MULTISPECIES: hypothetical protein [Enterococcus]EKK5253737.1 hypothetical protein [Enterococcus faecalis]EMF0280566.1 hypothetical protein [Enterococcus faecium]MBO1103571.1 hypothetical protein [Enterococcus hirae]MCU9763792.1 hypothetical protein [Enterococcus faecalis]OTN99165.1 hypothetical protein A5804_000651 [Enterococcus faecium]